MVDGTEAGADSGDPRLPTAWGGRALSGVRLVRGELATLMRSNPVSALLVALVPLSVLFSALGSVSQSADAALAVVAEDQRAAFGIGCIVIVVVGALSGSSRVTRSSGTPGRARSARIIAVGLLAWTVGVVSSLLAAVPPVGRGGWLSASELQSVLVTALGVATAWSAFALIACCIGGMLRRTALAVTLSVLVLVVLPVLADVVFALHGLTRFLPFSAAFAIAAPDVVGSPERGMLVLGAWVVVSVLLRVGLERRAPRRG
ncbi:hypothetical protein [Plantibacter sp. YIM 135347]|uniref:hypothetical protein n=1 Tax=Plantibacter sp. YIM 135347 TaxID=3423919 RepID=UPI003D34CBEC